MTPDDTSKSSFWPETGADPKKQLGWRRNFNSAKLATKANCFPAFPLGGTSGCEDLHAKGFVGSSARTRRRDCRRRKKCGNRRTKGEQSRWKVDENGGRRIGSDSSARVIACCGRKRERSWGKNVTYFFWAIPKGGTLMTRGRIHSSGGTIGQPTARRRSSGGFFGEPSRPDFSAAIIYSEDKHSCRGLSIPDFHGRRRETCTAGRKRRDEHGLSRSWFYNCV